MKSLKSFDSVAVTADPAAAPASVLDTDLFRIGKSSIGRVWAWLEGTGPVTISLWLLSDTANLSEKLPPAERIYRQAGASLVITSTELATFVDSSGSPLVSLPEGNAYLRIEVATPGAGTVHLASDRIG